MTYLLTWSCYGTHLPGDERGWIDRRTGGARPGSERLENYARQRLLDPPYRLDDRASQTVLRVLQEVCAFRNWRLLAAHARMTHVYCVVGELTDPSRAMGDLKAYASRALNLEDGARKRWSRHGSMVPLRDSVSVEAAVRYVVECQGRTMAVCVSHGLRHGLRI
jgi:REP element-mobilizing transposase RayT